MSPVLPREERDAIRARAAEEFSIPARDTVFALLDALDAAEEERATSNATWLAALRAERKAHDTARAEVAALRGRIEGLADRMDAMPPTKSPWIEDPEWDNAERPVAAVLRALAAAPSETEESEHEVAASIKDLATGEWTIRPSETEEGR